MAATQNFSGASTLSFVLGSAILLLLILLPAARRLGATEGLQPAGEKM